MTDPIYLFPSLIASSSFRARPFSLAVDSRYGILAWKVFCQKYEQGEAPDWAWKACKKGPFTNPMSKFVFWLHFLWAKITREVSPIQVAAWRSMGFATLKYFDAFSELEITWVKRFENFGFVAIQESNCEINFYARNLNDLSQ